MARATRATRAVPKWAKWRKPSDGARGARSEQPVEAQAPPLQVAPVKKHAVERRAVEPRTAKRRMVKWRGRKVQLRPPEEIAIQVSEIIRYLGGYEPVGDILGLRGSSVMVMRGRARIPHKYLVHLEAYLSHHRRTARTDKALELVRDYLANYEAMGIDQKDMPKVKAALSPTLPVKEKPQPRKPRGRPKLKPDKPKPSIREMKRALRTVLIAEENSALEAEREMTLDERMRMMQQRRMEAEAKKAKAKSARRKATAPVKAKAKTKPKATTKAKGQKKSTAAKPGARGGKAR